MGKKKVAIKSEEALLKEKEKIDEALRKGAAVEPSKKVTEEGNVYISVSYNNTIMSLTNKKGDTLSWVSAGNIGFKGTKKSTPFAASKVAEVLTQKAKKMGIHKLAVFVKGVGSGRESAIRSLATHGLEIIAIKDVTPIPHNGCRPPKVRRV